jgi:hypothetical protein
MPLQMLLAAAVHSYFCNSKLNCNATTKFHFKQHQCIEKSTLSFETKNKTVLHEKNCKHRNENGWCNKSQRQCALLNSYYELLNKLYGTTNYDANNGAFNDAG